MGPTLSLDTNPAIGMGTLKYLSKQTQSMRRVTPGTTRGGRRGSGGRNNIRVEKDPLSQQRQSATGSRIEQLKNLLRDTGATVPKIRTEVGIIDVAANASAEKATANETHTKALIEEVDKRAKKLNQYENGQLSNAMTTGVDTISKAVTEKQIEEWNTRVLDNMELMNRMIASMKIQHPSQQQLMLINHDEEPTISITRKISRHPDDDGSNMNTTTPKIHMTNNDTMIERHKSPPKLTNG